MLKNWKWWKKVQISANFLQILCKFSSSMLSPFSLQSWDCPWDECVAPEYSLDRHPSQVWTTAAAHRTAKIFYINVTKNISLLCSCKNICGVVMCRVKKELSVICQSGIDTDSNKSQTAFLISKLWSLDMVWCGYNVEVCLP